MISKIIAFGLALQACAFTLEKTPVDLETHYRLDIQKIVQQH